MSSSGLSQADKFALLGVKAQAFKTELIKRTIYEQSKYQGPNIKSLMGVSGVGIQMTSLWLNTLGNLNHAVKSL